MTLAEMFAAELKDEAAKTRKHLELIPEAHWGWKPHAKSMGMGQLGSHLAESLEWVEGIVDVDEFAFDPATFKPYMAANKKELLAKFDSAVSEAVKNLKGKTDAHLAKVWRLKAGDRVFFEMPRSSVIRAMVLNHSVHHRAQLGVYLRLKDVALPSTYGPSADAPTM